MSYNYNYDMKYTDNPYIDLLVHNTKIMAINSVVKNEAEALRHETLESRTESNKMISYRQGYPVDEFYDDSSYNEFNNYYRRLAGLPPYPTRAELNAYQEEHGYSVDLTPVYRSKYIIMTPYADMVDKEILDLYPTEITNTDGEVEYLHKYLHQLTNNLTNVNILESYGIINQIKQDYQGDDFKYIYYLGDKAIDPYTARTSDNFTLLYVPTIPFDEIYNKYKRVFERNRKYTLSVIYSEAYAYGSIHYDNFIMILIIIQTMVDLISEVQEYIINKDVFDSRTIKYLFESYGIDYYKEIPVRYQLAMIKNINKLIKYKSTNQNIVDICSLFGFPDIEVFSYYLLKIKTKSLDDFSFYSKNDVGTRSEVTGELITEDMVGTEKFHENYDLKFLRVPISDPNVSNYLGDKSLRRSYDYITNQDPFWDGISKTDILSEDSKGYYHTLKKNEILKQDFSCERTKYLSIDAAIDVTKMSYQVSYFMNILYDKNIDEDKLLVQVDADMFENNKVSSVRLNDLLNLGIALGYLYNDIEPDIIATDMEKNMTINGFNFDTDWTDIYNALNQDIYVRDVDGNKVHSKGWGFLAEIDSEFPGAFLSGRYKKCTCGTLEYDNPIVSDDVRIDKDEKSKKYTGTNPVLSSNGSTCVWTIYHGLNTKNCVASVITATSLELVNVDIEYISNNSCEITFESKSSIRAGSYYITIVTSEETETSKFSQKYTAYNPYLSSSKSKCIWTVNHNLNLKEYIYSVVDVSNNELINVDMININSNSCQIVFDSSTAIASSKYLLTIVKSEDVEDIEEKGHDPAFESIVWEELNNHRVYDSFECYDEYIYDGIDGLDYPKYLEDYIKGNNVTCIKQSVIQNPIIHSDGTKCVWDVQHGLFTTRCVCSIRDKNNEIVWADIQFLNKYTCRIILDETKDISANTLTLTLVGIYLQDDKMGFEKDTGFAYHEIDISWDTPYDPEQNSHANFINTSEIDDIEDIPTETSDDLARFNKLKELYTTNTNLYNHLTYMMNHAESKRMYDIYNTVFESFMQTKFSTEFYDIKDSNGYSVYYIGDKTNLYYYDEYNNYYINYDYSKTYPATKDKSGNPIPISSSLIKLTAETYYEYFKYRDMNMYNVLIKASKGFNNKDEQKSYITKICDYIVYALNKYFNSTQWKYIYNIIPTHNLEFIQKCILKVINFFKSWKTQMLEQSVDYVFNDPYFNKIRILDDMMITSDLDLYDNPSPNNFVETINKVSYREIISPGEQVKFSYT